MGALEAEQQGFGRCLFANREKEAKRQERTRNFNRAFDKLDGKSTRESKKKESSETLRLYTDLGQHIQNSDQ